MRYGGSYERGVAVWSALITRRMHALWTAVLRSGGEVDFSRHSRSEVEPTLDDGGEFGRGCVIPSHFPSRATDQDGNLIPLYIRWCWVQTRGCRHKRALVSRGLRCP